MKQHLIPITNDLFDVANRLRSVNDGYRVFFDAKSCKWQVHNIYQTGDTLAFIVPFDQLDCRTVQYARYTSVANAKTVLEDMERNNDRLDKDFAHNAVQQAMQNG